MTEGVLGGEERRWSRITPVLGFSRETKPAGCVCMATKGGSFKELVHKVVGTGKSAACRGVWEAGNSHTS